jgi:hypothetical protein
MVVALITGRSNLFLSVAFGLLSPSAYLSLRLIKLNEFSQINECVEPKRLKKMSFNEPLIREPTEVLVLLPDTHSECPTVPCADCLVACKMILECIKDGTWPMVESVKLERIAHFEKLIATEITTCGGKRGASSMCFSGACQYCRFCGACGASRLVRINEERIRFCNTKCELDWRSDIPNDI